MRDTVFFWGCQIPARLPFIEKSIRTVMEILGKDIADIEGFTCCPEAALVKSMGEEEWLIAAARNLANAGVSEVITGNVGPNAFKTLKAAGIKIHLLPPGTQTVEEALLLWERGETTKATEATVEGHWI